MSGADQQRRRKSIRSCSRWAILLTYTVVLAVTGYLGWRLHSEFWQQTFTWIAAISAVALFFRFVWFPFALWFASLRAPGGMREEILFYEVLKWIDARLRSLSDRLDAVDVRLCPNSALSHQEKMTDGQ